PTWLGVAFVSQYQPVCALLFTSGSMTAVAAETGGAAVSVAVSSVVSDSSIASRFRSNSRPWARPRASLKLILDLPCSADPLRHSGKTLDDGPSGRLSERAPVIWVTLRRSLSAADRARHYTRLDGTRAPDVRAAGRRPPRRPRSGHDRRRRSRIARPRPN